MTESSYLACISIQLTSAAGRTDNFTAELQAFLKNFVGRADSFSYAELQIFADGDWRSFYWVGDNRPDPDYVLSSFPATAQMHMQLNLFSDADCVSDILHPLTTRLSDGSLANHVRLCALTRDGGDASVFLSGMLEGAFHHGEIPFHDGMDGIPEDMCWNSCTHAARFTFPEDARDDAWDLSDLLEERIDEIDLDFSRDEGTLAIHSVQLPDVESVEVYRALLEQLCSLADSAVISGDLTPESENAFALLRFVPADGHVTVQTAIAEI